MIKALDAYIIAAPKIKEQELIEDYQQAHMIEVAILSAAEKGNTELSFKDLRDGVKKILFDNGYSINKGTISWKYAKPDFDEFYFYRIFS